MDSRSLLRFLSVLCLALGGTPGTNVEGPMNIEVQIWEDKVMVTWQPPKDVPENAKYLVQVQRSNDPRLNVTSCELTVLQQCDISDLITNYSSRYFVWVGLLTLQGNYIWGRRKSFTMRESRLLPPVFSLAAQSGSVTVKIEQKPELLKIFINGIKYTITLRRQKDNNQTAPEKGFEYNPDDFEEDLLFEGLPWGHEYCVDVRVESLSTDSISNVTEHCIYLRPDKFTVITFVVIAVFGAIVLLAITGIFCFLCHPAKMPTTLKTPGSKWQPLSIDQTPIEVVISNGWFLSRANPEGKRELSEDKMAILQEEEKRASLDSGVSMVTNSTGGDIVMARQEEPQEDSGCGSLGSSAENENSIEHRGSSMLPILEERKNCNTVTRGEDSGLGLGFNSESAGNLEGEDTGSLPDTEVLTGDGYRSQSPSNIVVLHSTPETTLKQTLPETDFDMAAPMVGYRPSQVIGHIAPAIDNGDAPTDTTKQDLLFSNYRRKTPALESLLDPLSLSPQSLQNMSETTPFTVTLPQFVLDEKGPDCELTTLPLSLTDMELTFG